MSDHINNFTEYHRNLPHWQQPGALHFLTLNLYDRSLCELTDPQIAPIVIDALRFFHGERYTLFDYTVMPDHAHLLMEPARDGEGWFPLSRITHSIKSWTANRINGLLARQGQFWQEETYDHVVARQERSEAARKLHMDEPCSGEAGREASRLAMVGTRR